MLVKNWMSKPAITIDAESFLQEAADLMKKHNIRGLPVMRNGKLAGYITDIDVKRAAASEFTNLEHITELRFMISKIKVRSFMHENYLKIPSTYTVDKAAEIMLVNKVSSAPVIDETGQIAGVITQTDIFRLLISLTGVERGGVQFALLLEDSAGSIREAVDIMRKYGGRVSSILTAYEGVPAGYRKVYIRISGLDRSNLEPVKEELGAIVSILYVVDNTSKDQKIDVY